MSRRVGWLFSLPGIAVLTATIAFPLGYALVLAFSNYTFLTPRFEPWAGIAHFVAAFRDPYFLNSVWLTAAYTAFTVAVSLLLGFLFALLLHQPVPGRELYYSILSIPMLISPVGVALIWKMILHPELGIVNHLMVGAGLPRVDWIGHPTSALLVVGLIDVWQQVSLVTLILLAGLRSLPAEPFEAAIVDGASTLQRFAFITLPLMRPVIGVVLILQSILELRTYDLIYVLTRGGPGSSTDLLAYFIYRTAFRGLDLAQASAMAYLLLAMTMVLVVFYYRRVFRESGGA
jgi:multiple sugar transport system permease protein